MKLSRKYHSMLLAVLLLVASGINAEPVTVKTAQGKLAGELKEGVKVFKGIPYALPPIGQRRWRPAEPAPGWEGTRLATQFAPDCAQLPYPEGSFFASPNRPTSEDCLYLNVWSAAEAKEKLPVMVWIHGGALTRGSGATEAYNGSNLAQKGVVLVTINYRLDIFGHFAHPALSEESPRGVSGNYGISDQIQALQWVQNNIEAFGGDPDNITIFGESAGSWSVHHLVATPLAKNLFHRAIGQSGAVLDVMPELKKDVGNRTAAEVVGARLATAAGAELDDLRALPAHEVLALSEKHEFSSRGIVDGWVFPKQIYNIMAAGEQNPVPVLLGFNADEGTTLGLLSQVPESAETYEKTVQQRYGEQADGFLQFYPADNLTRSTLDAFRDSFVTWPMQTWAMMTEQPAYLYYFSHRPPGPMKERLGAYHAAEIRYAFDNVNEPPADAELADIMSDYWVAFARTGKPEAEGRPQWLAYTAEQRHYMEFNNETKDGAVPGENLLPGVWEFHDKLNAATRP